jgi:hypothetical protein
VLIGHVEAMIRASPEQIVAYVMHFDSKVHQSQLDPEVDVRQEILEVKNLHHLVMFYEGKTAPGFQNRTALNSFVWRKVSDEPLKYVWVNLPIERHDKIPPEQEVHAVRAQVSRCLMLTRVGEAFTKAQYCCALNLNGHFPRKLTNEFSTPKLMRVPYDLQTYFLQVRPPSECTPDDGTCIGHMVTDAAEASKNSNRASAVSTFVSRSAILRECGCATLDAMLIGILATQPFSMRAKDVRTHDPAALTAEEAKSIGRGLESILRLSTTHIEAVGELLAKYPALGVMGQQHAWFRPMLETIAKRRMARAPLGLKLRLGLGAGLSTADMCSDIVSIVRMLQTGHFAAAYGMIVMISLHLGMQLVVSSFQTQRLGRCAVAWELLLVLSLAKPGIDAARVCSGAELAAGARIDPFTEMIVGKILEIAFEAAPGAALQVYMVLGGYWSTTAVMSAGISCLSIGFATTMMAFDYDTNPAKRKDSPEFYGCIPNSACERLLVFAELFTLHSAHAMLRTLTVVLLARTDWRYLVAYMVADHCVFIIYKIARGDFIHFIPGTSISL